MREKELEKIKEYKYGFSTKIENIRAPKGLNKEVIKFISNIIYFIIVKRFFSFTHYFLHIFY